LAHVAYGADVETKEDRHGSQHDNGDQRRWHGFGDVGEAVDDAQPGRRHGVDVPCHVGEFRQLGHEDQDGQRIDEAGDDGARDEAHQRAELEPACEDLQHPSQNGGGQQVLQAMIFDQCDHEQRHCACGSRHHAGATARKGNDSGDTERGVKPDLRIGGLLVFSAISDGTKS